MKKSKKNIKKRKNNKKKSIKNKKYKGGASVNLYYLEISKLQRENSFLKNKINELLYVFDEIAEMRQYLHQLSNANTELINKNNELNRELLEKEHDIGELENEIYSLRLNNSRL